MAGIIRGDASVSPGSDTQGQDTEEADTGEPILLVPDSVGPRELAEWLEEKLHQVRGIGG
jgi:hypothetical protein